ncbi:sensor histidine kinase [Microbulbifer aggregans]|uniref:sensor histidine kinase n=1 Tax=Microbulbifer aggregans TaxID=1769779 RepID=UPI001CFC6233|nr:HAMP domain-containing sensor histidine kinase [Microbulbifer aggregans]
MTLRQPLKQRIVAAFVLMTTLVGGAFAIGIVQIVHQVEEHLVSEDMHAELQLAMDALGTGRELTLDKGVRLFTNADPQLAPPAEFAQMKAGFSETFQGDMSYYVLKRERDGFDYLLVQDQSDFEQREQLLFRVVLTCFLGSVLIAWALGSLLANRVMQPVTSLAAKVRTGTTSVCKEPLASNYADDEVGRLAEAFDSTFERLQRSLDRERLFTGDVSHELRTPLMVIGTSCELLEQSPGLDGKQRVQVDRISRATREMMELVETLLLLAREDGADEGQGGGLSLSDAAAEQNEIWVDQFSARNIGYRCVVEAKDTGRYHAIFLRTVMSNLLRNALHYTEEGEVELVLLKGGFRVKDTGPGIAPEQQARLFMPFQRGALARGEGLGLGLSLVKRICERQGWSVNIERTGGEGCTFRVDLA